MRIRPGFSTINSRPDPSPAFWISTGKFNPETTGFQAYPAGSGKVGRAVEEEVGVSVDVGVSVEGGSVGIGGRTVGLGSCDAVGAIIFTGGAPQPARSKVRITGIFHLFATALSPD
jgi:hypothetical protein